MAHFSETKSHARGREFSAPVRGANSRPGAAVFGEAPAIAPERRVRTYAVAAEHGEMNEAPQTRFEGFRTFFAPGARMRRGNSISKLAPRLEGKTFLDGILNFAVNVTNALSGLLKLVCALGISAAIGIFAMSLSGGNPLYGLGAGVATLWAMAYILLP